MAHGYRKDNPCDVVTATLPKNGHRPQNFAAVAHAEVSGVLRRQVRGSNSAYMGAKLAFEFLVLTVCRSGEARGATWGEIDLQAETWTIPAERMKANREHRVPLSTRALEILEEAKALSDGAPSALLFPSARGRNEQLSAKAFPRIFESVGLGGKATAHGFRSSFRDWAAESGANRDVAEASLGHVVKGVEGAYLRTTHFEQRKTLMQKWADYCAG